MICQSCHEEFDRIATHWSMSGCDYPELTVEEHEIIQGVLFGDAHINNHDPNNPESNRLVVSNNSREFLEHVLESLPNVVGNIRFEKVTSAGNDFYKIYTVPHPSFSIYRMMYEESKMIIPKTMLTPLKLKYWYVCDGHLKQKEESHTPTFSISSSLAEEYESRFIKMFKDIGIETVRISGNTIYTLTEETSKIFDYMGDPVPGYEYKWPSSHTDVDMATLDGGST